MKLLGKIRKFMCEVLGWHKPADKIVYDGCNRGSICRYCGKRIIQDSQGNWFVPFLIE